MAAEPVTLPPGNSELRASFESRSGLRVTGWLLMLGGGIGGAVLMFTSSSKEQDCSIGPNYCYDKTTINTGQLIAGAALAGVGIGVGIALARVPDKAVVEVASSKATSQPLALARGVTLSGRF